MAAMAMEFVKSLAEKYPLAAGKPLAVTYEDLLPSPWGSFPAERANESLIGFFLQPSTAVLLVTSHMHVQCVCAAVCM